MERLFELLAARGWKVVVQPEPALRLPADLRSRYPRLPDEVTRFLGKIESCLSPQEDAWLLGAPDYVKTPEVAFPWDAIEQLALEACDSEAERAEQVSFWDQHFPIAISVRSDYDYLAICLSADTFGTVVHGYAPEWENPGIVSHSFSEILQAFEHGLSQPSPPYPFSVFV